MDEKGTLPDSASGVCAVTLSYNGSPFAGFARQKGNLLTVQGELEHALQLLFRREVPTVCAGRTDAGVHARAQVVSFELSAEEIEQRPLPVLARSLQALTHDAIVIRDVERAPSGFSARFSAKAREYRYLIACDTSLPLLLRDFSWWRSDFAALDIGAMNEAAKPLLGEHDFVSYCKAASAEGKPTCRNLIELSFSKERYFEEPVVVAKVKASSFLHSMVRTLIGTFVEVGLGHRAIGWPYEALSARDRRAAGQTAPAQGLVLWRVIY